jgi:hypothetical protein
VRALSAHEPPPSLLELNTCYVNRAAGRGAAPTQREPMVIRWLAGCPLRYPPPGVTSTNHTPWDGHRATLGNPLINSSRGGPTITTVEQISVPMGRDTVAEPRGPTPGRRSQPVFFQRFTRSLGNPDA